MLSKIMRTPLGSAGFIHPFLKILLRGFGQIMLQENALTGLLFLTGIFYGSVTMGLAAIVSVCSGTLAAKTLGYNDSETEKGLYGFSASLVGVALILFFEPVFIVWAFIIIGSVAAAMLQHFFMVKKIPVFTLPFVLVTWAILFLFHYVYPVEPSKALSIIITGMNDFSFAWRGYGQVIFQGSIFAGIAFFIGVFIHSPIAALYGMAGGVCAGVVSAWFSAPADAIAMGLFSYNAVLCAIVFAGNKWDDFIWVLVSVALSVIISLLMFTHNLTQLTFPFVAASCISLVLKSIVTKMLVSKKNRR